MSFPRDDNPADLMREALAEGEELLWAGAPQARWLAPADLWWGPIGLLCLLIALTWTLRMSFVLRYGGPAVLLFILGVLLLLVGVGLTAGRLLLKRWRNARTRYAVTDLRLLRLSPGRPTPEQPLAEYGRLDSLAIIDIPAISKTVFPDGTGTVRFGEYRLTENTGLDVLDRRLPLAFVDIDAPDHVYALVTCLRGERAEHAVKTAFLPRQR